MANFVLLYLIESLNFQKLYKVLIDNVPNFKKFMKKCVEYSLETGFASIEVTGLTKKVQFKSDELKDKKNAFDNFKVIPCNFQLDV